MTSKKVLLWLFMLLVVQLMFASQMHVVGEVFSSTSCGYCPDARSGLSSLYEQQDYVVPMIWTNGQHASPGMSERANMYNVGGVPHAEFGGYLKQVGGGTDMYPYYLPIYNQIVDEESPLEIDVSLNINGAGNIVIAADVTVTGTLETDNNKVVYILTRYIDNSYFATVCGYAYENFDLTNIGDSQHYEHELNLDPDWNLVDLHGIALVQTWNSYPAANQHKIFQAGITSFSGYMALFSTNIQQGPPALGVQFTNNSFPQDGSITSFEWDFDGDGTFDSTEENPYHVYTEPGTYDVTLRITGTDGNDEKTIESCITVQSPQNVYGTVNGVWSAENNPYIVTGDVSVPEGFQLEIEPGTVIKLDNAAIIVNAGLFKAVGEIENPIVFTSDNTWNGIDLIQTTQDNVIENCQISNVNAVHVIKVDHSKLDLINNRIYNNYGVAMDVVTTNDLLVKNNIFANNTNYSSTAGINAVSSVFDVKNNIFVNNQGMSGGVFILRNNADLHIVNNTIANNSSNAIFFIYNSMPEIVNSIVWETGNIFTLVNSVPLVSYSCISGGYEGPGNIDSDPMFENPSSDIGPNFDGLNALWYLQDGSPCIDAGDSNSAYNDVEDPNDAGNALWPAMGGLRNDMGAFGGAGFQNFLDSDIDIINSPTEMNLTVYPNPFSISSAKAMNSTVMFNTPQKENITIDVFNMKGQKVKTVFNGTSKAGVNTYSWNGTDADGKTVSTGIYFYMLKTDKKIAAKKVVLIK